MLCSKALRMCYYLCPGEAQATAQRAWTRANLRPGTKHCDRRGAGLHPQMPPVLPSQTAGRHWPQGPSLKRPFIVMGFGGQEWHAPHHRRQWVREQPDDTRST